MAGGCFCPNPPSSRAESRIPTSPSCLITNRRQASQPSPPLKSQWKMSATIHFVIFLFSTMLFISESMYKQMSETLQFAVEMLFMLP